MICSQGTGMKTCHEEYSGTGVTQRYVSASWVQDGKQASRSAGVAIIFGRRVRRNRVCSICTPAVDIVGRAGARRFNNSAVDITVINAYVPPHGAPGSRKTTERMLCWLREVCSTLPKRTTVVFCMVEGLVVLLFSGSHRLFQPAHRLSIRS